MEITELFIYPAIKTGYLLVDITLLIQNKLNRNLSEFRLSSVLLGNDAPVLERFLVIILAFQAPLAQFHSGTW